MTGSDFNEQHRRVKEIFLQACEMDADKRSQFVSLACGDDEALKREVDSLLSHHDDESDPMFQPVVPRPVLPPEAFGSQTQLIAGSSADIVPTPSGSTFLDSGRFTSGTVLNDRYRITAMLGRGGMGEVYRADDLTLGQTVALKFLPRKLSRNKKWLDRFLNEVRIARQIAHPNVCRVYDVVQTTQFGNDPDDGDDGSDVNGNAPNNEPLTFLTMEYVDGEDLASLLRRIGRLPKHKATDLARQLCAGLSAAHKKGILHRDLKPTNIMIDGQGQVRITDFGLAAPLSGPDKGEIRAGTPAYMAPEQISGKEVSVQSDIYSLGLVLYEIVTGKQAFKAKEIREYERLHTQTRPSPPSRIVDDADDMMERIIIRCVEKDPRHRPTSALAVAAALPGADPLAAALAAGETPSPEMVAAAGGAGAMPAGVAWPLLALAFAGLAAAVWLLPQVSLVNIVPLDKQPEVLADRAEQIIADLGFESPTTVIDPDTGAEVPAHVDRVFGFREDQQYISYLEQKAQEDRDPTILHKLADDQPAAIHFWYRQSPRPLVPSRTTERVTLSDPPQNVPGMVTVILDPAGRLIAFERVPDDTPLTRKEAGTSGSLSVDWNTLFEMAGLNPDDFVQSTPSRIPKVFADATTAWVGTYPEDADNPSSSKKVLELEAAAYNDRVVLFGIVPQWREEQPGILPNLAVSREQRFQQRVQSALLVIALVVGVFLAWHNINLGRGDRRGGLRVATFIFAAGLVEFLVGGTHTRDFLNEIDLFSEACGRALYQAAQVWVFYLALEPFVRRMWPETIISWSRLLSGRFTDAQVGRDLLIGGTFAVWAATVGNLTRWIPNHVGGFLPVQPRNAQFDELTQLLGWRMGITEFANTQFIAISLPLLWLLTLLLLRGILRDKYIAASVFVGVLASPSISNANWILTMPLTVLLLAASAYLLMRFGLVALISAFLVYLLLTRFPITADLDIWYAEAGIFSLGLVTALLLYSCITAQSRRASPSAV